MERLIKSFLLILFVPCCAFAYDFSYLERKITPGSFEMCIYNAIKDVIANGEPEKDIKFDDITTYVWNDAIVKVYENTMSKTTYPDPDTTISFIDKTFGIEEVLIAFNEKHDYYRFIIR